MRRLIAVSREGARMGRFIAVSKSIRIALGLLRQEMGSLRVMLGYLLGMTFLALALNDFFGYAMEIKEPVNIWEAFIVMENQGIPGRFWVLGYLFVIADAPFVRRNTYMLLYRSGRRVWNMGMLLYVLIQAFLYLGCFAAGSVIAGIPSGFSGRLWSSPVYLLATHSSNAIAEKYHVFFDGAAMMEHMTVLQAFGITFLYLFCYAAFLGILLYVCNLILGGFWGLTAVAAVHVGGAVLSFAGRLNQSPVYYVGGAGSWWRYPGMMAVCIFAMAFVSMTAVGRVDIQAR